jgi:hypothetical protein
MQLCTYYDYIDYLLYVMRYFVTTKLQLTFLEVTNVSEI